MNQDFSILTLVVHASFVVQLVMAGLMIASLASWTVIFGKLFGLKRVRSANEEFLISNEEGAKTQLYCATAPELAGVTGRYYDKLREVPPNRLAEDPALARTLFVEPEAAGPEAMKRRVALMRGFAEVLVKRAPAQRRPTPRVAEAIIGSVWNLVELHIVRGKTYQLPKLAGYGAFLTLAPILGAAETIEVRKKELGAAGRSGAPGQRRRRPPGRGSHVILAP